MNAYLNLKHNFLVLYLNKVIFVNNIKAVISIYDDPKNYLLSVSMAIQWDIKNDWEQHLTNRIEYFISFYFHYLKLPSKILSYEVQWENKQIISFTNPNATENFFVVENFSYKYLLSRVKPNRILELINAVLLERQIFIIDDDMSQIAIIIKSILSLIRPLWWVNPVVPMIPKSLSDIIGSPFGVIIGIHSDIWTEWWECADDIISNDAYILFLNTNETICENELAQIPFYEELKNSLMRIIELQQWADSESKAMREWKAAFEKAGITQVLSDRVLISKSDIQIYAQLRLNLDFFWVIFWRIYKDLDKYIDFRQDK